MSCCWCSGSSRNPEPLKRVAQPRVVVLTIIYSNHAKSVFATSFFAAKDLPSEVQHCDTILAMILLAVQKGNNIPVRKSSVPRSVLRRGTDNAKQFSTNHNNALIISNGVIVRHVDRCQSPGGGRRMGNDVAC